MSTARGSQLELMLIEEATWGSVPATPAGYIIPVSGVSGDWYRRNLIDNPELRGNRNPAAPVRGNVSVQGSFQAPLKLNAVGWLLKHGIGDAATTGTAAPYTHTFKVGFSDGSAGDMETGLTIEHGYTDIGQYHYFTGCRVNSLGFTGSSEGVAIVDVGVIGQDFNQDTDSLDASPTTYTDTAIDHFAATIDEGGSSSAIVTDVTLTLSNNLDPQYVIGSAGQIGDLPEGGATVNGSLTALFQNDTLLGKGRNHTESELTLTWTSGSYSLALHVPELVYEPSSPAVSGPGGVKITMNFRGYYANDADATALKATLINTVADY